MKKNPTDAAQAKCDALMKFMSSLKEADKGDNPIQSPIQSAKELVEAKLREDPEDSDLTRYRPGVLSAYKNMSTILFKFGDKRYGFDGKAVESRTGHFLAKLEVALSAAAAEQEDKTIRKNSVRILITK